MAEPSPMPITAAHLLCVYAEPLAAGRRVLVIGDASADLGGRLIELGARAVHVYDPVAQRVDRAPHARGVTVQPLREAEFEVRDGAFDLAIVPDVGTLRDPAGVLARLRRIVGPDGAVLVSSKNPEAPSFDVEPTTQARRPLDYYELYDLVSMQFTTVRMIGQVPFHGFAIAELGESDGDPEVTVDTQLITEGEPPEYFLALASQKDARLEPYAIVQVPREPRELRDGMPIAVPVAVVVTERVVPPPVPPAPPPSTAAVAAAKAPLQAALMEAQLRATALAAQLDEERALRARQTGDADRVSAHADRVTAERIVDLEEALAAATQRIEDLEEALVQRMDACRQFADETDQQRAAIAMLEGALRAAQESVPLLEERLHDLQRVAIERTEEGAILFAELVAARAAASAPRIDSTKVDQLVAHASRLEARVLELEGELHHSGDGHGAEVGQVEALLRERAQAIQALERELLRRERMIQDLLAALEDERAGKAPDAAAHAAAATEASAEAREELVAASRENATLRAKLDAMALDIARREGELQTLTWKIAEQAEQLQARAPEGRAGRLEEELDFVKKALTQEHESRVRAETELARQAALVEKLSGELDAGDRVRIAREGREEGGAS